MENFIKMVNKIVETGNEFGKTFGQIGNWVIENKDLIESLPQTIEDYVQYAITETGMTYDEIMDLDLEELTAIIEKLEKSN
jgi:hypothetical protein